MNLRAATVLVVDDHPPMRDILKSLLFGLGAKRVLEAEDARDGLHQLLLNPVQLALVDYELGGMTGVDLIRLTRREHQSRNRRTPIIMVSGHASPQVILGARDAGVNEFLRKPVTPAALAQKVALALGSGRPFIETSGYVGPCRRRRALPFAGEDRRGRSAQVA